MNTSFGTENFPLMRDSMTFEDRQKAIWEDMSSRMNRRSCEWERELENMRRGFFHLRPAGSLERGASSSMEKLDDNRSLIVQTSDGSPTFKVNFDLNQFKAEEISVSTKEHVLFVHAKHQEKVGNSTTTREFSKKVEIPANVDPQKLASRLSADGILTVEAKLPAPIYSSTIAATNQQALQASPQPPSMSQLMQTTQAFTGGPLITTADGTRKFQVEFDVSNFAPEEVAVKTENRRIKVHARHEEKTAGRTSYREYNKEYDIPDTVDAMQVSAYISDQNKLIVQAPLKAQYQQQAAIEAPKPKYNVTVHHT